jgi:hypothetical protein
VNVQTALDRLAAAEASLGAGLASLRDVQALIDQATVALGGSA